MLLLLLTNFAEPVAAWCCMPLGMVVVLFGDGADTDAMYCICHVLVRKLIDDADMLILMHSGFSENVWEGT